MPNSSFNPASLRLRYRLGLAFAFAFALGITSDVCVLAYYDDTHYSLSYAIGRMLGYTPEQCYRLASACYSIDYSGYTEPEQRANLMRGLDVRTPRLDYHAFMDDAKYSNCLSDKSEADMAAVDIGNQAHKLFGYGAKVFNPGIFLHFYQDSFAHEGYSASGGHWFSPTAPMRPNYPLGPYCDWLSSFEPTRHLPMVNGTVEHLRKFMAECCPEQSKYAMTSGIDRSRDATIIFDQLREANPRAANLTRVGDFIPNVAYGKEPDFEKANKVVANYTKRDFIPFKTNPKKFKFEKDGSLYTDEERDEYVLWGDLRLTFSNAPRSTGTNAKVEVILRPTRSAEKPYSIYRKELTSFDQLTFNRVPVGEIEVEISGDAIESEKKSIRIDKQVVIEDIKVHGKPSVRASAAVDPPRPLMKEKCMISAEALVEGLSPAQIAKLNQRILLSGPGFKNLALADNVTQEVNSEKNGYRNQWAYIPAQAGHFELVYEYRLENGRVATGNLGFDVAPPEPLSIEGSSVVTPPSVEQKEPVQLSVNYAVRNLRPSQTAKLTEKIWIAYPTGGKDGQILSNGVADVSSLSPSRKGNWNWTPHMPGTYSLNFRILQDGVIRASGSCPFVVAESRGAPLAVSSSRGYWEYNTAYRLTFDARTNQFRKSSGQGPNIIGSVSGDTVTLTIDSRPQFNIVEKCILKKVSPSEYRGKAETVWRNGRKPEYPLKVDCWLKYYEQ